MTLLANAHKTGIPTSTCVNKKGWRTSCFTAVGRPDELRLATFAPACGVPGVNLSLSSLWLCASELVPSGGGGVPLHKDQRIPLVLRGLGVFFLASFSLSRGKRRLLLTCVDVWFGCRSMIELRKTCLFKLILMINRKKEGFKIPIEKKRSKTNDR